MTDYINEAKFRRELDKCIKQSKEILSDSRGLESQMRLLNDSTSHYLYEDKFDAMSNMSTLTILCIVNVFRKMGLTDSHLQQLAEWLQTSRIACQMEIITECKFKREIKTEEDIYGKQEITIGNTMTITSKAVMMKSVYEFEYSISLRAIISKGTDRENSFIELFSKLGSFTFLQLTEIQTRYPAKSLELFEVDLTFLMSTYSIAKKRFEYAINRSESNSKTCLSPINNSETTNLLTFLNSLNQWSDSIRAYITKKVVEVERFHIKYDASAEGNRLALNLICQSVKIPIFLSIPTNGNSNKAELSKSYHKLISNHFIALKSSIDHFLQGLDRSPSTASTAPTSASASASSTSTSAATTMPTPTATVSVYSRTCQESVLLLEHLSDIAVRYETCLRQMENIIRSQLINAVGKVLTIRDFDAYYNSFHVHKLFDKAKGFAPTQFSYAVRRSAAHSAEGSYSIMSTTSDSIALPIQTFTAAFHPPAIKHKSGADCTDSLAVSIDAERGAAEPSEMLLQLNSSTTVSLRGKTLLHGWMLHSFSGDDLSSNDNNNNNDSREAIVRSVASSCVAPEYHIQLKAKPFNSYVALLGRIIASNRFEAMFSLIIRENDEVIIPLSIDAIPSKRQFKRSIQSISPEQQRFATFYRSMQLSSSLFGMIIIPIQSQLERILNIPTFQLIKEVQLTRNALHLLCKYHIPTDQLSFDASAFSRSSASSASSSSSSATLSEIIESVRTNVSSMQEMIKQCEDEELHETKLQFDMATAPIVAAIETEQIVRPVLTETLPPPDEVESPEPIRRRHKRRSFIRKVWDNFFGAAENDGESGRKRKKKVKRVRAFEESCVYDGFREQDLKLGGFRDLHIKAESELRSAVRGDEGGGDNSDYSSEAYDEEGEDGDADVDEVSCACLSDEAPVVSASSTSNITAMEECKDSSAAAVSTSTNNNNSATATDKLELANKAKQSKEVVRKGSQSAEKKSACAIPEILAIDSVPETLEREFEKYKLDDAIRPTIITPTAPFRRCSRRTLLSDRTEQMLTEEDLEREREEANHLIDVLSKSGGISIENTTLHVIVSNTHHFDSSLMSCIVKNNVNPIETVDRSSLVMASVLHARPMRELVTDSEFAIVPIAALEDIGGRQLHIQN